MTAPLGPWDGAFPVAVRGTFTITLDDGREATVEFRDLDLRAAAPPYVGACVFAHAVFGEEYPYPLRDEPRGLPKALREDPRGPMHLSLDVRLPLADLDSAEPAYTITTPVKVCQDCGKPRADHEPDYCNSVHPDSPAGQALNACPRFRP